MAEQAGTRATTRAAERRVATPARPPVALLAQRLSRAPGPAPVVTVRAGPAATPRTPMVTVVVLATLGMLVTVPLLLLLLLVVLAATRVRRVTAVPARPTLARVVTRPVVQVLPTAAPVPLQTVVRVARSRVVAV